MQASLAFMNGAGIRTGKSGRGSNAFLEVLTPPAYEPSGTAATEAAAGGLGGRDPSK